MAKKLKLSADQKRVSTQLVYLDLNTILANYKKPEFWRKKWLIYENGTIKIYWNMVYINVKTNKIHSEVSVEPFTFKKRKIKHVWSNDYASWYATACDTIPIDNPDYRQEMLNRNILTASLNILRWIEDSFIQDYAEYKTARRLMADHEEELRQIAEKIADEYIKEGEYADTIREAFIEKYLDEQTVDYTTEVINNYRYKVFGSIYLGLCSWFGNQKRFEEYQKLIGDGAKKHIWIDMFRKAKEIQTDEWRNAMSEELRKSI